MPDSLTLEAWVRERARRARKHYRQAEARKTAGDTREYELFHAVYSTEANICLDLCERFSLDESILKQDD